MPLFLQNKKKDFLHISDVKSNKEFSCVIVVPRYIISVSIRGSLSVKKILGLDFQGYLLRRTFLDKSLSYFLTCQEWHLCTCNTFMIVLLYSQNVHTSFMRTVAPYSDQASVWVDMVKHFQWKKVIFMHSSDEEGRAMLGRFQSKAEERGIEVRYLYILRHCVRSLVR